ncbi:purine-cytosine permease family protein [Actinomadura rupiterrae]|uniref:purine-cytosine permease family protein n=1 Tax=Actinomadura rupiterrae TaxID=559627 RepID=UPI0020A486B1|nr:cytosine permease [Actinomadura rupiterrae]MCP2338994.1 purine-cytosine permease-like protein [Actinomadura rupiterrae]
MASTIPDPLDDAPPGGAATPPDRAGRVEVRGIDHVPDDERHGRPRELFAVWAAPSVSYLALVVGGALVLMGLGLWQALALVVAGNAFWLLVGLLAASGPAAGAPSEVITRAVYGIRGNRINVLVNGWFVSVCYVALNWAAAALAAFALLGDLGVHVTTPVKVATTAAIAVATLAISVYGHATIVRLYPLMTWALTAAFAVLAWYVLGHAHWDYRPEHPLHGSALWAAATAGLALVASGPLSYSNSADFSRYLPRTTSAKAVAGWTAVGAFVPSVLFTALGTIAGTAVDMTDPQVSLAAVLPDWFEPVFLLSVIVGTIANNAMTAYSSGLALQAVGLRLRRSRSVALDGTLGLALTLYALLISNFLDTVNNMLQVMVVLLGPSMAIYAADILLRRNRYDGPALGVESRGGPFWYIGGVNPAGAVALLAGAAVASQCVHTTAYTGEIAKAMDGVDLSLPTGMLISAALYVLLMRRARTAVR